MGSEAGRELIKILKDTRYIQNQHELKLKQGFLYDEVREIYYNEFGAWLINVPYNTIEELKANAPEFYLECIKNNLNLIIGRKISFETIDNKSNGLYCSNYLDITPLDFRIAFINLCFFNLCASYEYIDEIIKALLMPKEIRIDAMEELKNK